METNFFIPDNLSFKIESSLKILSFYDDRFFPYHVAFSGGRDSVVLNWLLLQAGVNFRLFFYDNVLIPKVDRNFVLKKYPGCKILKSKYNLNDLVQIKKILPTRVRRFCCEYWKELHGSRGIVLTGIRKDESFARSLRHVFDLSHNSRFHFYKGMINPLSYFSNDDISYIISSNNLTLSEGYALRSRNGCIGCPMSSHQRHELYTLFPKYRKIWENASDIVYKCKKNSKFSSGADVFQWWLSNLSIENYLELKKQKKLNFIEFL